MRVCSYAALYLCTAQATVIRTPQGAVRCNTLQDGVTECLGMPFAEPPTGSLRWSPPKDLTKAFTDLAEVEWAGDRIANGTLDATAFGPAAQPTIEKLLVTLSPCPQRLSLIHI